MTQEEKIDWTEFEDRYIRLEPEKEKVLVLTKWRMGTWFGKVGISFVVGQENGLMVDKQFTTTSRRLVAILKPILQKAGRENRKSIRLSITRMGDSFDTSYEVEELPLVEEEVVPDE